MCSVGEKTKAMWKQVYYALIIDLSNKDNTLTVLTVLLLYKLQKF